ncbi:MAG: adenosylmethionine decarboxylase [Candidatus Eremiobacteraeota bacterium]|nr:adenosylmethionine decarboxylase [Candidatus Eremiobacteraeota bacterium]
MKALGTHIVCELSGCSSQALSDVEGVRSMMVTAAKEAKAEIMEVAFHRFHPQGVSGVVVIAESHLSIHTWPETGYAAMDFYTCGDRTNPWAACEYAAKMLGATSMLTTEVKRGIESSKGQFTHLVTVENEGRAVQKRSA